MDVNKHNLCKPTKGLFYRTANISDLDMFLLLLIPKSATSYIYNIVWSQYSSSVQWMHLSL